MSDELKELKEKLLSGRKNGYDRFDSAEQAAMDEYCEGYKAFLDKGKTERLCAAETIRLAEAKGYKPYVRGMAVSSGDKVYLCNRGKCDLELNNGAETAEAFQREAKLFFARLVESLREEKRHGNK